MDWLHFVGKCNYKYIHNFTKEAEEYKVSRRISKYLLGKFNFGDRVYLFQWNPRIGKSTLFGYFVVDSIYGEFDEKITHELQIEVGPKISIGISRACGSFEINAKIELDISLEEIAKKVKKYGCKYLMIGGTFVPHERIDTPIEFQRGFRNFDYNKFKRQHDNGERTRGQYYTTPDSIVTQPEKTKSYMVQIVNYKTKAELKKT